MSENITHTAVVDDCARLVLASREVCSVFRDALTNHLDLARLGGITRHGDEHNPGLLEALRARFRAGQAGAHDLRKLAFVIGWLSHRAADRQMKRIWRVEIPGEKATGSPTDCSVYHDAFLLREHYGLGARPPYVAASLADRPECADAVEQLFQGMWQRMLIAMHTFIPDDEDVEAWLDRVLSRYQHLEVDLRRYAEAIANPDPEKVRRYLDEVNFYSPHDPIVDRARRLDRGDPGAPCELSRLADRDANASRYGQALARGCRYILAASEFFLFRLEPEELRERLDIGKPECDP